jgi:Ca2+-binding EF-hand superfamily protein
MTALSQQQKALAQDLFCAVDFDSDGALSREEFTFLMQLWTRGYGEASESTISVLFGQSCAAGTDVIDMEHFERWVLLMMGSLSDHEVMESLRSLLAMAMERRESEDQASAGVRRQAVLMLRSTLREALQNPIRR